MGDLGVTDRDWALVVLLDGGMVVVAVDLFLHSSNGTLGLVLVLEDWEVLAGDRVQGQRLNLDLKNLRKANSSRVRPWVSG